MNESRRASLRDAIAHLRNAESTIERVCDEEQDSMDNMPENLQSSDRYSAMEDAVDHLEDAIESVQEAANSLEQAMNS